ncbi:MAG TPA: prenyltransferase/squalene oxidase repeat-containing protein [Planctomycetota bacterium]|nr:prenyltransferase/squalene oxidase repeat-containing protein [Planctomycetota bacterium]
MSSNPHYADVHIESTLPKPWEQGQTFNDLLYDWMGRAPYLAIAIALHFIAFLVLNAIPWDLLNTDSPNKIQAAIEMPPEEPFEEPEEEEIEEIEEEVIEEPVVQTDQVVEEEEVSEDISDTPFDSDAFNDAIGIGGGAGGKGGGLKGRRGRRKVDKAVNQALLAGLEWLKDHQSASGAWDCDGFPVECSKAGPLSDGEGDPLHDVGVTGLALLAFLGFGDTMDDGDYKDVIKRGVDWLLDQQDPDSGLIGEDVGEHFLYRHSIATLALCEAYYGSKHPILKRKVQLAVNYIHNSRNSYAAWRYTVPPNGQNDTSVTGWMVFALAAANEAGLDVDFEAFRGALSWFDEVTDPQSGRTGYDKRGGLSSRSNANMQYPATESEAMTAVAVLCRVFIANVFKEDIEQNELLTRGADLMLEKPPLWSDDGLTNDMYYWYYGSYAMYQLGGKYWQRWEKEMEKAIIPTQRNDPPCFAGSWDPNGPWGYSGGRVYSTALMVLNLEVFFRYDNLLGTKG